MERCDWNDEVDSTRAMGRLTAEPNAPCAYESAVNKYIGDRKSVV